MAATDDGGAADVGVSAAHDGDVAALEALLMVDADSIRLSFARPLLMAPFDLCLPEASLRESGCPCVASALTWTLQHCARVLTV